MKPSELLRMRPPLGENISITRGQEEVTGTLIGFAVRPEKVNATGFGQAPSYLAGQTTITLTLGPWWVDIDLSPEDEITVTEVYG